jgi:SET domain-containing protein
LKEWPVKDYLRHPWLSPKVRIGPSKVHGKGMFSTEPICRGEAIAIWGGNFVARREAENARRPGVLIQQIDDDVFEVFAEENKEADPTYFQNHSCDPNVWMKDEVTLVARRDIHEGEELTIDYALFERSRGTIIEKCNCGSAGCRQVVTGEDWKSPELQKRYKGHFAPMINRMIEGLEM